MTQPDVADAACADCEAQLIVYHLEWWRATALAATAELEELRAKYDGLERSAGEPAHVAEAVEAQRDPVFKPASTGVTSFLDRVRQELTELCRGFDGAVPFYRLKNTVQDFSDRLTDDERVLLAAEIGADGSLIRWATTEVESLGSSVMNNRVQENTDMMWEEWLQECQQTPAKPKRRFGRSR